MPDDSNPFGSLTGAANLPLSMRDAPPPDLSDSPKPAEKKPPAPKAVTPLAPKEEAPPRKEPPAEGPVPQGGIPRAPELTPPPVAQSTDPLHQWGSIAMIVAGLGSLLTRSHATTALNAAAGVMKGFHQNDLEAANTAFQEWKVANENTTKMANYELQAYKAMMADKKLGLDAIRTQAEAMKDYATIEHLKVSDDPEVLFAKKQKIIDDSIDAGAKLDAAVTRQKALREWTDNYTKDKGQPPSAAEINAEQNRLLPAGTSELAQEREQSQSLRDAALKEFQTNHPDASKSDVVIEQYRLAHPGTEMSQSEIEPLAQLAAQGKFPFSTYTLRTAAGRQIMARAQEINPNFDPRDYTVGAAFDRWMTSGKGGDQIQNLKTVEGHLQVAQEAAGAMHNGDYQAVNALANRLGIAVGNDPVTNFEAVRQFVGAEIARAVVGGGTGAGALADRQDITDRFGSANSPQQLLGVINYSKSLISSRIGALADRVRQQGIDPIRAGITSDLLDFFRTSTSGAAVGSGPSNPKERTESIANLKAAVAKNPDRRAEYIAKMRAAGITDLEMQAAGIDTGR